MFWKMLRGALIRRRGKLALIAAAVALGSSLATALLNVMFDAGDKINRELKTYGANLTMAPRGAALLGEIYRREDMGSQPGPSDKYIQEADLVKIKMIFWAYNIVDFTPYLETPVRVGPREASLAGVWFDRRLELPTEEEVRTGLNRLKPWWEITGRPGADDDPFGALMGRDLAESLGLRVGDPLAVDCAGRRTEFTVRGVFNSGGPDDGRIFAPLKTVQELTGRPGLVDRVEISALTTPENELARRAAQDPSSLSRQEWDTWYCTAYISAIAYQLEEILPGVRVRPILQVAEAEGLILTKTQLLMTLLTLLTLACSALAVSNLVTATVMERGAELGLLKSLGAADSAVALLVLAEIAAAAALGWAAGCGLGLGLAQIIGRTVFGAATQFKALVPPLTALLALAVTLLGSLPALGALLRLRPADILHGR